MMLGCTSDDTGSQDMCQRTHVLQSAPAATAGGPHRSWRRFSPLAAGPSWCLRASDRGTDGTADLAGSVFTRRNK